MLQPLYKPRSRASAILEAFDCSFEDPMWSGNVGPIVRGSTQSWGESTVRSRSIFGRIRPAALASSKRSAVTMEPSRPDTVACDAEVDVLAMLMGTSRRIPPRRRRGAWLGHYYGWAPDPDDRHEVAVRQAALRGAATTVADLSGGILQRRAHEDSSINTFGVWAKEQTSA